MKAGMEKFLRRELDRSVEARKTLWKRDFSSRQAYEKSVEPNRERFRRYIGAVDPRVKVEALEFVGSTVHPSEVARTKQYTILAVRWPVLDGVNAEGLLLQPAGKPLARVVALSDADQTPEMLVGLAPGVAAEAQLARRLVENGCQVLVPVLIDRQDTWSGNPKVWLTNQPHREWVYRPAFSMGRHIIGYEVQKVLAAVDWFQHDGGAEARVGVAGYAEGGLLALYSAAVDPRIDAVLVSGYFDSRQNIAEEPIYRNVFGLLNEFGDAEVASLIAPRHVVIEHSPIPKVEGPPPARDGRRAYAAPGKLTTPTFRSVRDEIDRARELCPKREGFPSSFVFSFGDRESTTGPGSEPALEAFLEPLGVTGKRLAASGPPPTDARRGFDPALRQHRQLDQLVEHTQKLLHQSDKVRAAFWAKAQPKNAEEWRKSTAAYRDYLWDEVIGRFQRATEPINPRSRRINDRPKWTGYEVLLDVYPDVFVWGILLVPKDIQSGERRPVVVCQHGLEGQPMDVVTEDPKNPAFEIYKGFASRLAERGFVTFAPHNFYRGGNRFRQLQRLANPLKKSLFGLGAAQHDRLLDWLSELPFVDPQRIGFYGLSYGGNAAVRIPALLERYALSISSADFNDWTRKTVSVHDHYSLPFYNTYEAHEFNLGHTFNHADLAALIAPRPFMVERGHTDGVAPDEWVAGEYARVRRLYAFLGIPDRTRIEFFNGPHAINGVVTFEFLHQHLRWPERKQP
jgi:dienelactone hydrolase